MKLDYFTTLAPWPQDSGGRLRVHAIVDSLERHGAEVRLFVLGEKPSRSVRSQVQSTGGSVYPRRPGPAGVQLRRHVLGALLGHDPFAAQLFNPRRLERLGRLVAERRSDAVVLGNVYLTPLIPTLERLAPATRIIVDNHNVESLLQRRLLSSGQRWSVRVPAALVAHTTRRLEQRYLCRASQVWACSDEDAAYLRRECQLPAVHVVPNGVDTQVFRSPEGVVKEGSARAGEVGVIVFTGSFWYPPNDQAASSLMDLSDRLRARDVRHTLYLVGQAPTAAMARRAHPGSCIVVTGAVPDVRPYLAKGGVFAAPLDAGSGTKLKLLQAMAMGLAIVTTPIGAEGLRLTDGKHAIVTADRHAFERHLVRLLHDPAERARLGAAARAHVVQHFSLAAVERAMAVPLDQLGANGAAVPTQVSA